MVRIAWHSVGTYNVKTKTRGPFGTMRHSTELALDAISGICKEVFVDHLQVKKIMVKAYPTVSADYKVTIDKCKRKL